MSTFHHLATQAGGRTVRRSVNVGLLKNIIKHVQATNKAVEEQEMWEQYEAQKDREKSQYRESRSPAEYEPKRIRREEGEEFRRKDELREVRASSSPVQPLIRERYQPSATGWRDVEVTKAMLEREDHDIARWGHGGFKELYADELAKHEIKNAHSSSISHVAPRKRSASVSSEESRSSSSSGSSLDSEDERKSEVKKQKHKHKSKEAKKSKKSKHSKRKKEKKHKHKSKHKE